MRRIPTLTPKGAFSTNPRPAPLVYGAVQMKGVDIHWETTFKLRHSSEQSNDAQFLARFQDFLWRSDPLKTWRKPTKSATRRITEKVFTDFVQLVNNVRIDVPIDNPNVQAPRI